MGSRQFSGGIRFFLCPLTLMPGSSKLFEGSRSVKFWSAPCELNTPRSVHIPVWGGVCMDDNCHDIHHVPQKAFYKDDDFPRFATLYPKPSKVSKTTNTFRMISNPSLDGLVGLINVRNSFLSYRWWFQNSGELTHLSSTYATPYRKRIGRSITHVTTAYIQMAVSNNRYNWSYRICRY